MAESAFKFKVKFNFKIPRLQPYSKWRKAPIQI